MTAAGYSIHGGVISPGECVALGEQLMAAEVGRSRAGARHLMRLPAIAAAAHDPRLMRIARESLGASAVPFRATLFEKSGPSNWLVVWHQDTALPLVERFEAPGWGPWSTKCGVHYAHAPTEALERILALRLHLDDSSADNGPLLVVPGSHTLGVLSDDEVFRAAHAARPAACLVARGGVVAMHPLLIHSSQKAVSREPRRVLHIEYAASLDLAPGVRLAVA